MPRIERTTLVSHLMALRLNNFSSFDQSLHSKSEAACLLKFDGYKV
jgi:hypothetical protein